MRVSQHFRVRNWRDYTRKGLLMKSLERLNDDAGLKEA